MIRQRRKTIVLLVAAVLCCCLSANAEKRPKMRRVYMFGFAASFTDSVACQTTIQPVDSAWLDDHGFLIDRSLYSLQLQYYMEHEEGVKNATPTVFFHKKQRKLNRLWEKVNKRYMAAQELILHEVPEEKFRFKCEEYRPVTIEEMNTPQPPSSPAAKGGKPAKESKKKKKQ